MRDTAEEKRQTGEEGENMEAEKQIDREKLKDRRAREGQQTPGDQTLTQTGRNGGETERREAWS